MRTKKFTARSAPQLESLSRQIGEHVDDAAIDRILAIVDLAGTTGILPPDYDASNLTAKKAAEIKRARWGGEIRSVLSFLTAMVRRRKLNISRKRQKISSAARALLRAKRVLGEDPANEAAFQLTEMGLERVRENLEDAKFWTTERIAGEYLPAQYHGIVGKEAKMTRPKVAREKLEVETPETIAFIQAVLTELDILYSRESIIAAMQAAKKPIRKR